MHSFSVLLLLQNDLALVVQLKILHAPSHLLLVLLEVIEVVQVEQHGCDQEDKVEADPEVWMASSIVLKHDQRVFMHSVLPH